MEGMAVGVCGHASRQAMWRLHCTLLEDMSYPTPHMLLHCRVMRCRHCGSDLPYKKNDALAPPPACIPYTGHNQRPPVQTKQAKANCTKMFCKMWNMVSWDIVWNVGQGPRTRACPLLPCYTKWRLLHNHSVCPLSSGGLDVSTGHIWLACSQRTLTADTQHTLVYCTGLGIGAASIQCG